MFDVDLEAASIDEVERHVEEMTERLPANPTIHDYTVEVTPAR